ncbi:hypothetical protein [Rhodovulum sulfidophilum]|uniref:Uncharacterized protein n=1 Tax=Rhodovulum sulfidophilum TaxID=35806 RepID=A0ABS1RY63_RHOSU|nr:hypothetical protein [Rhodovulum sulfidophilum]MBL3610583.1 hypothetical protein [Rhodovulum sulfidophilum]MCE8456630.1 hypothetical protein [Rhodovulum sulfidophilum]
MNVDRILGLDPRLLAPEEVSEPILADPDPARFGALFGMDDLRALIATVCSPLIGHKRPYLRVVKEKKSVQEKVYGQFAKLGGERVAAQVDPKKLRAVLDSGATLNINFLEELHPTMRGFADETA